MTIEYFCSFAISAITSQFEFAVCRQGGPGSLLQKNLKNVLVNLFLFKAEMFLCETIS